MPVVKELLDRHVRPNDMVLDPFARDAKIGTVTNDLNPNTSAMYHLDAVAFLDEMLRQGQRFNVALFDPPYSSTQVKRVYQNVGREVFQADTQMKFVKQCRDRIDRLLEPHGIVISFGWNSSGMGVNRGYELIELMLVSHGGTRYDTIVTVERKRAR
jgi:hypothetical protein